MGSLAGAGLVLLDLLVKAFTAPFALLAGSDGPDLSVAPFVPGTARLAGEAAAALERVATALNDRPALRMTVTGAADPVGDRDAICSAAFEAAWSPRVQLSLTGP